MSTLWLVGQHHEDGSQWDCQGIFSSEKLAIAACKDYKYFVGPLELDQELPEETMAEWLGCYYPHAVQP